MSGARVPFDPGSPFVVASQELACGPKRFVRGDEFPWRELGISELDLLQLWQFFKVDCVVPPPAPAAPAAPAAPPAKTSPKQSPRR